LLHGNRRAGSGFRQKQANWMNFPDTLRPITEFTSFGQCKISYSTVMLNAAVHYLSLFANDVALPCKFSRRISVATAFPVKNEFEK
jgi:hypothetical protein